MWSDNNAGTGTFDENCETIAKFQDTEMSDMVYITDSAYYV